MQSVGRLPYKRYVRGGRHRCSCTEHCQRYARNHRVQPLAIGLLNPCQLSITATPEIHRRQKRAHSRRNDRATGWDASTTNGKCSFLMSLCVKEDTRTKHTEKQWVAICWLESAHRSIDFRMLYCFELFVVVSRRSNQLSIRTRTR